MKMNRDATRAEIISLIERLRTEIPDLAIRTTFIVGFPGEREKDFKELINFIKEVKFERLGVFTYSKEEGTTAAGFREQIPESIKQARYDEIMRVQQTISAEINASFLGRELEVLIDELPGSEPGWILGRTEYDAPEVDGQVWVKSSTASPGDFIKVKITDTLEYDLVGENA